MATTKRDKADLGPTKAAREAQERMDRAIAEYLAAYRAHYGHDPK